MLRAWSNTLLIISGCSVVLACSSDETSGNPPGAGGEGQGASAGMGGAAGTSPAAGAGGTAGAAGLQVAGSAGDANTGGAGQAGAGGETGSGSKSLYEPCQTTAECLPGLHCQNNVPQPQGGQCSHACTTHDECESVGNSKGLCHPNSLTCVLGCGVNGGQCPDGLICTDVQFCTESSDLVPTKNTGEACTTELECLNDATCVSGEYTAPYCSPHCSNNEDCTVGAPDAVGTCNSASGLTFCIYLCGIMAEGAKCPGDMVCDFGMCR